MFDLAYQLMTVIYSRFFNKNVFTPLFFFFEKTRVESLIDISYEMFTNILIQMSYFISEPK